jgi:hypothetical protein
MILIHEAFFFLKAAAESAHGVVGCGEGMAKIAEILRGGHYSILQHV